MNDLVEKAIEFVDVHFSDQQVAIIRRYFDRERKNIKEFGPTLLRKKVGTKKKCHYLNVYINILALGIRS